MEPLTSFSFKEKENGVESVEKVKQVMLGKKWNKCQGKTGIGTSAKTTQKGTPVLYSEYLR